MLNARVRASALAIFALAFCLLPIGAAVACEVCPPTDCHEQVVRLRTLVDRRHQARATLAGLAEEGATAEEAARSLGVVEQARR